jgi:hypothetical protein
MISANKCDHFFYSPLFFAVAAAPNSSAIDKRSATKNHTEPLKPATQSACAFGAFVNETDRAGLNVRQTPSAAGRLLGKLPAKYDVAGNYTPARVEVEVLASQNGWFLIEGAKDNTTLTEQPARPTYSGKGWVSGKKLAIKTQASRARLAPEANAGTAFLVGNVLDGDSLNKPGHLVACIGKWVLVEYSLSGISKGELSEIKINPAAKQGAPKGHVRGWVNRICAIQETSCDGLGDEP